MLDSLTLVGQFLFSHGLVSSVSLAQVAENESHTNRPQDPSTLTLALIGAASLMVYLAYSRGLRKPRQLTFAPPILDTIEPAGGVRFETTASPDATEVELPSRGAA